MGTVLNIIFIYVIRNGTRHAVGQIYKHMMTCFAICNIAFVLTEFIAKPIIYIYGFSLMTFSHGLFERAKPWGLLSLCLFMGMYGVNTALLSLHFVYRYIAVCRHDLLHIFRKPTSITIVISSVFSWGVIYGFITFYCFAANENYYRYANLLLHEKFGDDIHNLSFFCIFTHEKKGNETIIYWSPTLGIGLMFAMMIFTFTLMLFCGAKLYRFLKRSSMSRHSKILQTQLLRALVVQATIPFFATYLSRAAMYTTIIVGIPPLSIYSFTQIAVTSYTVIDPIVLMFFLCDFRRTLSNLRKNIAILFCTGTKSHDRITIAIVRPSPFALKGHGTPTLRVLAKPDNKPTTLLHR
ncbi:hypothetical protein V3C99_007289 [Haemonchus contortus]|uniref:G_PROTEIN_RECEP_F1_2 domain-containing protein n=1 Tax=Haemonchus contortus TaxID=6289 RepID=A0A7I4YNN5_HAECO